MGDGILNLSNLGWVILLGVLYLGAKTFQEKGSPVPPEMLQKFEGLIQKIEGYPLFFLAVMAWVVLRCLFALGWQLQMELLIVIAACTFVHRQLMRVRTKFAHDMQRKITMAPDPAALLGKNLPEWVTYPSANRVQWLNTTIAGLWPSIVGATEKSIRGFLEPLLERTKPSFVYGFKIRSANIGARPMILNGMQHHSYGTTETTLDISASWDADMDIRLLVQVPGPDIEVSIKDFEMRLTLRLTLGPHIPQWPCVANMAISIVGTPEIDFDLVAGRISLDSVPGLGRFLDTFIRNTLVGMLSYPKGFIIPLVQGYKLDMGKAAGALGTLKVKFLRMENLLPKYSKYKKTPWYCRIAMTDSEEKRLRGTSYKGFDAMMSDVFSFTLYDNTGTLTVWMYIDVPGTDVCVGTCVLTTQALINNSGEETEVMIIKPSDPSKRRRASVIIKADFLRFQGKAGGAANGGGGSTAPPDGLPPRTVPPEFIEGMLAEQGTPVIPSSRGASPRAGAMGSLNSGTLFVQVDSASDLKNLEKMSKSDPYVFLRVNGNTRQSETKSNNLNPIFNWSTELPVQDCDKDTLKISFIDKNDVGKDKLMGHMEIPIARIIAGKSESLSGEFDLQPQGKTKMTMNFLRHS